MKNVKEDRKASAVINLAKNVVKKAAGGSLGTSPPSVSGPALHTGPIHSHVAGRTDHLNMHVPHGSYVIPADIVSSMGEGNTMAGFKIADKLFGAPYGGVSEVYGDAPVPAMGGSPYEAPEEPYGAEMPGKAAGGAVDGVPIVAAGGEYVIHPDAVMGIGDGDLDQGHRHLDEFIRKMRAKAVGTLQKLPGPKRD
jgi:hypothetical protein